MLRMTYAKVGSSNLPFCTLKGENMLKKANISNVYGGKMKKAIKKPAKKMAAKKPAKAVKKATK